jgi:hypothetical protein
MRSTAGPARDRNHGNITLGDGYGSYGERGALRARQVGPDHRVLVVGNAISPCREGRARNGSALWFAQVQAEAMTSEDRNAILFRRTKAV